MEHKDAITTSIVRMIRGLFARKLPVFYFVLLDTQYRLHWHIPQRDVLEARLFEEPNNARLRVRLGMWLYDDGDFAGACRELDRVAESSDDAAAAMSGTAWRRLARSHYLVWETTLETQRLEASFVAYFMGALGGLTLIPLTRIQTLTSDDGP